MLQKEMLSGMQIQVREEARKVGGNVERYCRVHEVDLDKVNATYLSNWI